MPLRRSTLIPLALAASILSLSLGTASAQGSPSLSRETGARLIRQATEMLNPARRFGARASAATVPSRDLTLVLVRLARALPSLSPAQQRRVRGLLARPTDDPDPDKEAYSVAEKLHLSTDCTTHFCVHWIDDASFENAPELTDLAPANGLPDYVDEVEVAAEEVHAVENGDLGWRDPKPDGALGGSPGDPKTDIYLSEIGDAGSSLFGYANTDLGQAGSRRHAYLVIDNDFSPTEFPGTTPLTDLQVTLAHEYNHVLQFAYDTFQDPWFMESTATWMEDRVYGSVNDYLRYLDRWNRRVAIPITATNVKNYGSAVWDHWLAERYGASIVRAAWAESGDFALHSYDAAIRRAGASDFPLDFARFARDLPEWRTATAFPEGDLYPDVERQGSLRTDGITRHRVLDHTTYRLLRVKPATARGLRVEAAGKPGVATALAVVGRIGGQADGTVVTDLAIKRRRGRLKVWLDRPGRFERITVVVVNPDAGVNGFGSTDWRYTGNDARVALRARLIR